MTTSLNLSTLKNFSNVTRKAETLRNIKVTTTTAKKVLHNQPEKNVLKANSRRYLWCLFPRITHIRLARNSRVQCVPAVVLTLPSFSPLYKWTSHWHENNAQTFNDMVQSIIWVMNCINCSLSLEINYFARRRKCCKYSVRYNSENIKRNKETGNTGHGPT